MKNTMKFKKVIYKTLTLILAAIFMAEVLSAPISVNAVTYEGIEIRQKLMVMMVGDNYELDTMGYYTMKSGRKEFKGSERIEGAKWKTSDKNIAEISSKGKLTAKKPGRCIITAAYGKKTAQCKVRVYTEKELYQHVLDAEVSFNKIVLALTTDYYKGYDLLKDADDYPEKIAINIKAMKRTEEILASVITKDMSDFEKMIAIVRWLVENITIDDGHIYRAFDGWYSELYREYFMYGPLLDGKADSTGIALAFEHLMNACGIRCEYVKAAYFNTESEGEDIHSQVNVVELEGDFYYLDVSGLAYDYKLYNSEESDRKYTFYDLLDPLAVDEFINTTTAGRKDEYYEDHISPRISYYDKLNALAKHYDSLGFDYDNPSKYDGFYYDFYNDKVQFITKEQVKKNNEIYVGPVFSTPPLYPDSTSSKYKIIMKTESDLIGKMVDMYDLLQDYINCEPDSRDVLYDISGMDEKIASLVKEFENTKDKLADRNVIPYMKNKIEDIKKAYAEVKAL